MIKVKLYTLLNYTQANCMSQNRNIVEEEVKNVGF